MNEPSNELQDLDLGDKRFEKRADRILKAMLKSPQSSIPQACQLWLNTLATYRFFWNEAVSHEALITPLGRLSYDRQRGMYLHPTLCITSDRLSLGITDSWMWSRGLSKAANQANPSVKESCRWVEGYERVAEMAARRNALSMWLIGKGIFMAFSNEHSNSIPRQTCYYAPNTIAHWVMILSA